jgi:hypothetical protein
MKRGRKPGDYSVELAAVADLLVRDAKLNPYAAVQAVVGVRRNPNVQFKSQCGTLHKKFQADSVALLIAARLRRRSRLIAEREGLKRRFAREARQIAEAAASTEFTRRIPGSSATLQAMRRQTEILEAEARKQDLRDRLRRETSEF